MSAGGLICAAQQQYDDAVRHYRIALQHYTTSRNLKGMSTVLTNLGHIEESRAQYPEALQKYRRALDLTKRFDDPSSQAFAYNNLGSVYWKRGNHEEAVPYVQQGPGDSEKALHSHVLWRETLNNLGIVYLDFGKYDDALQRFQHAYHIAQQSGSPAGKGLGLAQHGLGLQGSGSIKEGSAIFPAGPLRSPLGYTTGDYWPRLFSDWGTSTSTMAILTTLLIGTRVPLGFKVRFETDSS